MMEQGTIVSAEVLPKVAKEMAKAARSGGALAAALKTVRVQEGNFNTQLQKSQDTIFNSGYGEGLASFYKRMVDVLKRLDPMLKVVGKAFGILFDLTGRFISMWATPLEILGNAVDLLTSPFKELGETSNEASKNMLVTGALMLTPWGRLLVLFNTIKGVLEEIMALTTRGVVGKLERDLGRDVGFDLLEKKTTDDKGNIINSKGKPKIDNTQRILDKVNEVTLTSVITNYAISAFKDMGVPLVNIQPIIDHSGGIHIETAIERSIQNGQAQR